MRERLKNKKGFTLAELLIVVAIIAILVAIMIPVFGKSRANAILAKNAANVRSVYAEKVVTALEAPNAGTITINMNGNECKLSGGAAVKWNSSDHVIEVTVANATIGNKAGDPTTEVIDVDSDVTINGLPT